MPKDASFDPLYINNWFQNLLRRCEDLKNEVLFLFIDDLHKLNPLDCDIVAALSWLPISLPWNVFLICTSRIPIDLLKLTPMQKERFKSAESLYDLIKYDTTVKQCVEDETFEVYISRQFDELEERFGKKGLGRLATYITCSEYGLSETELLELLMPTFNCEALIDTHEGDFNFSTFKSIRVAMGMFSMIIIFLFVLECFELIDILIIIDLILSYFFPIFTAPLIREKLMSGKMLIEWRHDICSEISHKRYIDAEAIPGIHEEIANLFFPSDNDDTDDTTEHSDKLSK